MPFVLDASVTLAWSFRDEQTPYSRAILHRLDRDSAQVPPIWLLDVANGLLVGERRGRVTADELPTVMAILDDLPIQSGTLSVSQAFGRVLELARAHQMSAYDASYIELARREGIALATQDDDMRAAAEAAGVALVS